MRQRIPIIEIVVTPDDFINMNVFAGLLTKLAIRGDDPNKLLIYILASNNPLGGCFGINQSGIL
jgi:hypothetical protein